LERDFDMPRIGIERGEVLSAGGVRNGAFIEANADIPFVNEPVGKVDPGRISRIEIGEHFLIVGTVERDRQVMSKCPATIGKSEWNSSRQVRVISTAASLNGR
jgi:hypothetical protein